MDDLKGNDAAESELNETTCSHEFMWFGSDTSRCKICGLTVPDKEADRLFDERLDAMSPEEVTKDLERLGYSREYQKEMVENTKQLVRDLVSKSKSI